MTVRVRGIYATALTALFENVVQPSAAIQQRFDDSFSTAPADAIVETTGDRQGIGVHDAATGEAVTDAETVVDTLRDLATDTLAWRAGLPRGGVFAGEVVETLGSGAVVACRGNDGQDESDGSSLPLDYATRGFLPYSNATDRVEEGDRLRVQVVEVRPPWADGKPVLDTELRLDGGLATLVRGRSGGDGPALADIVPAEPPEGWSLDWQPAADDVDLETLGAVVDHLDDRTTALESALAAAPPADDAAPRLIYGGDRTCWLWFGRDSRSALDDRRRSVTTTMVGHHRIKVGSESASAAVDFVESLCDDVDGEFPFDVVTRQFGPREGESVGIGHGKPDGRVIDLGPGTVVDRTADGTLVVEREMASSGTYDALGTDRQPGDTATTKFSEGRWWYPTVYRRDGASKGTYVNVCTPVEVFPDEVRYVDLHVDVVKRPDGSVERVDDDELSAAVETGTIPASLAEKARTVARAVENAL